MAPVSVGSDPGGGEGRVRADSHEQQRPVEDSGDISTLVSVMVEAWRLGKRVTARELLERHPGLDDEAAIRLVYEEVCLRRDEGETVETAEVIARHPRWRDELEMLLRCDRLLRPTVFPAVGEDLGPFRLLTELGRGASGRTFLAYEPTLADRPVVLKVTASDQEEHLALARLQHTYIVPLYTEYAFPGRGLRALCMPYLGGASLDRILSALAPMPLRERRGRDILRVIDHSAEEHATRNPSDGPFRRYLEQATYVQAICWVGACLADALHYAHARGMVHMDLKPSNVLISGDGQPMLLDFHLARGPIRAGEPIVERIGGTPGWMSPEQQHALEAVKADRPIVELVDGRSDIYALGLLLREALAGGGPLQDVASPEISVGLGDIVAKCLDVEPNRRYRDATTLADDLRRHLSDLPLAGVPNRSLAERWRKWRRRRPGILGRGVAWTTAIAAVGAAGVLLWEGRRQHIGELHDALEDGRRLVAARQYSEAIRVLRRAAEQSRGLPLADGMGDEVSSQLLAASLGQRADELHDLAELVRFRYGVVLPSGTEGARLLRQCNAVWGEGKGLLRPTMERPALDAAQERRLRDDLLDVGVVGAELRVRLASKADASAARREARHLLEEAEGSFGPSPIVRLRLRELNEAAGETTRADAPTPAPRSSRDDYELGRYQLRNGHFARADESFRKALAANPADFWSHFYQGLCALRLEHFEEAAGAFRACLALQPTAAPCHYNQGLAYDGLGRLDLADAAYRRALELDPELREARLNRGVLSYKAGRPREAVADFRRALGHGLDPRKTGRVHFNLALAYLASGDREQAAEHAAKAAALGDKEAVELLERIRAGR